MVQALLAGFAMGASLIVAIGVQNALLLRIGLKRDHVGVAVLICIVGDLTLITAGVAGLGTLLVHARLLSNILRWAGVAYLGIFALRTLRQAWRGGESLTGADESLERRAVVTSIAAATFLNPHVYIDTVVLLGTISSRYPAHHWWFGVGAACASVIWFSSLGFGARLLRPLFTKEITWRALDVVVGVVVGLVAISLVLSGN
jgi:L-lysine exporter family protein LysE/ArgO